MMTTQKSHVIGFLCRAQEAHIIMLLGMWIAVYWPKSDFRFILKACVGVLAKCLGSFCADHVRFDPCHP